MAEQPHRTSERDAVKMPEGGYGSLLAGSRGQEADRGNESVERAGSISMASWKIAEDEMRVIQTALLHPPKPVEWLQASYAVSTAVLFAIKTLIDTNATLKGLNIFAIIACTVVAALAIARVVDQARTKYPFHDIALGHVEKMEKALTGEMGKSKSGTVPQPWSTSMP